MGSVQEGGERTVAEALSEAGNHHRQGRHAQAEQLYRAILSAHPAHPDANHNLGVLAVQLGKPALGLPHLKAAVEAAPAQGPFRLDYAEGLLAAGHPAEALRIMESALSEGVGDLSTAAGVCERALIALHQSAPPSQSLEASIRFTGRWPDRPIGWKLRFKCHSALGRIEEALGDLRHLTSLDPQDADAHLGLGAQLQLIGRPEEAEAACRRALAIRPDYARAHNVLGATLADLGRLEEAESACNEALAIQPDYAEALDNLGGILRQRGRAEEAESALRRALAARPDYAAAHNNLGNTLRDLGRLDEAQTAYLQALAIAPELAEAHANLANLLREQGRLEEAESTCRQALGIKPDDARAHMVLGAVLDDLGRIEEAEAAYRRALEIDDSFAEGHANLGTLLDAQGRQEEALACYDRAIALKPAVHHFHSNRFVLLNSREAFHRRMTESIRHWRACCAPDEWRGPFTNSPEPTRPLRVGIVSPDLRRHSVAYFIEPLFRGRDRDAYRLYAYSDAHREDEVSARLRAEADRWRACFGWSDERLRRTILEDGIDILVDLAGHTRHNRLLLFARRAAPVQISYLGYSEVTGLPAMDYRITDGRADPPDDSSDVAIEEREELLRLPESFLCFEAPAEAPAVSDPPMLEQGPITFGSFNNLSKLTPEMVAVWAELLRRVPGSRLILKYRSLADQGVRRRIESLFEARGVDPARLRLLGMIPGLTGHLALYNEVDVALDTHPYHGTTTTCEALWMGVPVVTLAGARHVSRVGVSLLEGLGLAELIAGDEPGYIETAARLATDPERLRELRRGMRARMRAAPLMDGAGFNRAMERLFREVWERWVRREREGR